MKWTLCIVGALVTGPLWGMDAGTTSASFLKLGVGPRAIAMGEAQTALADDVYATYWNPAGLAQLQVPEAGFMYNQYFQGINEQYLAYAHPTRSNGTLAASLNLLSTGRMDGYDASGQPTDSVGSSDLALGASYGRTLWGDGRLGSQFAVGTTAKFVREKLDTASAQAVALDAGLLFKPGLLWGDFWRGWSTGLTVRNLGSAMKFDNESFALPRSLNAGLGWSGKVFNELLTATLEGQQPNDGSRSFGAGLEIWTLKTLVLRAGYTTRGDLGNGLRTGAGLHLRTIQLDYAYAGAGDFGTVHRMSLTFRFGQAAPQPQNVAQVLYLRGVKEYKARRFTDALVDFNKALEVDPSHPEALDMMHKTYDEIKKAAPDEP